jgi:hypothetical protein
VPGRQFVLGQRLEHVELVAIWVGHDYPADVALADADLPGAERLQPGDFGVLVGGAQIQVEPVLDGLAFGDLEEYQVGSDAIFRAALRWLEADLVFLLPGTAPAQRGFPEAGDPGWVGGVYAQALDAYVHVLMVLRRAGRVQ